MARRGAMAKNPPLRGQARRNFRQAQREAVASGGAMPTQNQFRPRQQPQQRPRPTGGQMGQQIGQVAQDAGITDGGQVGQQIGQIAQDVGMQTGGQAGQQLAQVPKDIGMQAGTQFGQMPPDKMYRFPRPAGGQGATLGAAMGMPQPSANNSGKYRLSPGVYGTKEQAMKQFNNQMMQRIGAVQNQGEPMRYPGGSPNFNEAGGGQGFNLDQLNNYMPPAKGEIQDGMFRSPGVPMRNIPGMNQGFQDGLGNSMQMPQPSANNGGKYRLSPGVYGTKEQAMGQWARQPAVQMRRRG